MRQPIDPRLTNDMALSTAQSDNTRKPANPTKPGFWLSNPQPGAYVIVLVLTIAAAFGVKLRLQGIFACPASYGTTAYLSDCNSTAYGDYDHGAFWFGLEPEARRAASNARVLVLGNSRIE